MTVSGIADAGELPEVDKNVLRGIAEAGHLIGMIEDGDLDAEILARVTATIAVAALNAVMGNFAAAEKEYLVGMRQLQEHWS